jgi:transposase
MFKKICRQCFSQATITVDKFHILKHVYDLIHGVRIEEKNKLSKDNNLQIPNTVWTKKQLLTKSRYLLVKPKGKWNEDEETVAGHLFRMFPKIELAYQCIQRMRDWYNIVNKIHPKWWLEKHLEQWIEDIEQDLPTFTIYQEDAK